jgi:hypothetical protein
MRRASTKTIGLKIHTNEHVNKNGKCDDSNQRVTLSNFSLFTEQLIISRAKTAISISASSYRTLRNIGFDELNKVSGLVRVN